MNFILARFVKPAHGFGPPDGAVAQCWFDGIWPTAEVAKKEAAFASGQDLTWIEVEPESHEFKSYRTRGYHPRRIFKAYYMTASDLAFHADRGSGLWLLYDHTEPPDEP